MTYEVEPKENDILIMATDGLWDNIFDEELIKEISKLLDNGELKDPKGVSNIIAKRTKELSTQK